MLTSELQQRETLPVHTHTFQSHIHHCWYNTSTEIKLYETLRGSRKEPLRYFCVLDEHYDTRPFKESGSEVWFQMYGCVYSECYSLSVLSSLEFWPSSNGIFRLKYAFHRNAYTLRYTTWKYKYDQANEQIRSIIFGSTCTYKRYAHWT